MKKSEPNLETTKKLMGALVRMKPKPHEDMKVGQKKLVKQNRSSSKKTVEKKKV